MEIKLSIFDNLLNFPKMNLKAIQECERKGANRLMNFKLPSTWKRYGWIGFAISFIILLSTKFFDGDLEILKNILKKVSLVFLFVVVISKEKIEDERIQKIRGQAFSFTFLAAVLYVLVQPLVTYFVALLVKSEKAVVEDLGDFQILWFMLIVYLVFFHFVKKRE